jgi:hypothetical protein
MKAVLIHPRAGLFFRRGVVVIGEHIMQNLLWCYAHGKHTQQEDADNTFYRDR